MGCLECGSKFALHTRFMVIPGHIMVPNQYFLCDEHKDKTFNFDDIYNKDGTRK